MTAGLLTEVRAARDRLAGFADRAGDEAGRKDVLEELLQEVSSSLEELRVAAEEIAAQRTEVIRHERELEDAERRYKDLFELAPDAYLEADLAGKVLEANQRAVSLVGVPAAKLIGKPFAVHVSLGSRRAFREAVNRAGAGRPTGEVVVTLDPPEQPPLEAGISVAPAVDRDGRPVGIRILVRDLTHRPSEDPTTVWLRGEAELLSSLGELTDLSRLGSESTRLRGLVDMAARSIAGCEVSIVLAEGDVVPYVSTDERAGAADQAQLDLGSGPSLHAVERAETVSAARLDGDDRWPAFARRAVELGFLSVLATPVILRGDVLGALNLYAAEPDFFTPERVALAALLADQGAVALSNARLYETTARLASQLEAALESRGVIEQAKGILMADQRCGPDEAFDLLRRASQKSNMKLRDIAAQLVAKASGAAGGSSPRPRRRRARLEPSGPAGV